MGQGFARPRPRSEAWLEAEAGHAFNAWLDTKDLDTRDVDTGMPGRRRKELALTADSSSSL